MLLEEIQDTIVPLHKFYFLRISRLRNIKGIKKLRKKKIIKEVIAKSTSERRHLEPELG